LLLNRAALYATLMVMKTDKQGRMDACREQLKNPTGEAFEAWGESDERKGIAPPPIEKPFPDGANRIPLIAPEKLNLGAMAVADAIRDRQSRRAFSDEALTFEELSYLLWATQGIRKMHPEKPIAFRVVPSGGCRHPYETYLQIERVEGVPPGLYRYGAVNHELVFLREVPEDADPSLADVCFGQGSVAAAAVTFAWTAIPYRTEWRYGPDSPKDILLGCGHICQNLYLACESIGAGTCAIVAYDQEELDAYLGVDGVEEVSLYAAPVGKAQKSEPLR